MLTGSLSTVLLIFLSPTVQVDLLGRASALFPLKNPGIITMPLAILMGVAVSLLFPEPDAQARYAEVKHRMHVGHAAPAPANAAPPAAAPAASAASSRGA
jgi:cation/acetate symporter